MRHLARTDLFFLLRFLLGRKDLEHEWLHARCCEVETEPYGYLDLWSRFHYKSTIITFAKTIQDILASYGDDPLPKFKGVELTTGIFSHTRPTAKAFLRQIKVELEQNKTLQELFPDILYPRPDLHSPQWNEDSGIVVKRRTNPKEATVEAWGLVDGQPTSKHFGKLLYDDVVTRESVSTPEMIKKTTEAWELSTNLGTIDPVKQVIGTRYHFADTYRTLMDRGALKPRIHPATKDGTLTGEPVFLTPEQWAERSKEQGPYMASAQLLLNPIADSRQSFRREWFEHRFDQANISWQSMTRALICDPASEKKRGSDWTAMAVIGKSESNKVYVLDFIRDRLNLKERGSEFIHLHRRWQPQHAAYEKYGMQADIEYIKTLQDTQAYHFDIRELGGNLSKPDRINRLIPVCADGKLWLPEARMRCLYDGKVEEQILVLIEQEFLAWPVPIHDDGMDVISRYFDVPDFDFPEPMQQEHPDDRYNRPRRPKGTWMSR